MLTSAVAGLSASIHSAGNQRGFRQAAQAGQGQSSGAVRDGSAPAPEQYAWGSYGCCQTIGWRQRRVSGTAATMHACRRAAWSGASAAAKSSAGGRQHARHRSEYINLSYIPTFFPLVAAVSAGSGTSRTSISASSSGSGCSGLETADRLSP